MRVNQAKKSAISWLGVAGTTQPCESCKNKLSRAERVARCIGQPQFGQLNVLRDETGLEGHWRSGEERTIGCTHAEGGDGGVVRALRAEIEFAGDQESRLSSTPLIVIGMSSDEGGKEEGVVDKREKKERKVKK